jgi:hypothetical protein
MMLVLERPEAAAVKAPKQAPTRVQQPPAPDRAPRISAAAVPQPQAPVGMAWGATPGWNTAHGRAMRGVEAVLALCVMAYFGSGLLAVLGIW